MKSPRRAFLATVTSLGAGALAGAAAGALAGPPRNWGRGAANGSPAAASGSEPARAATDEPNSPPEYMMLDHAVLERLLSIYEECVRRLRSNEGVSATVLQKTATMIRNFGEDYHEKREEEFIFPHFAPRADYAPLLKTLQSQHDAGRTLTDRILAGSSDEKFPLPESRQALIDGCTAYVRMARPHMAREATDLFPDLYETLAEKAIDELSARLLKLEQQVFGKDGYERMIEHIAVIEQQLGIHDLDRVTPKGA